MSSHRNQQIIAVSLILSLVVLTLIFVPTFNPGLEALTRFLDQSEFESSSTNSINTVYRSPDFHAHSKSLELTPSSTIDVRSNSSLQLNDEFTVAAWFKTSHFYFDAHESIPYHFMVNKGGIRSEASGRNMNYGIWMNDLHNIQGGFETETGVDYFVKARDSKYNDGNWHYVILAYDGNMLSLYVDGILKDIKVTNNAEPDSTTISPVSIGVNSHARNGFFIGSVDEISIWDRQLDEEELKSLHESGILSNNGLVFHMSFE